MKCLSVCQPFANLIVTGRKRIELRRWNTRFRGEFLVHAPMKVRREDIKRLQMSGEFATGAIIGKVEIFEVKRYETTDECRGDYHLHLASKEFHGRRYGFMLRNAKAFRVPVPYSGKLGFFEAQLGEEPGSSELVTDMIEEEYRFRWVGHH